MLNINIIINNVSCEISWLNVTYGKLNTLFKVFMYNLLKKNQYKVTIISITNIKI